jgi:NAD(P)-dependent dehydrogenase (short-subunit alcohol dehydrogenase family)
MAHHSHRPVFIVTGAARGLGKAVAEKLVADGAAIVPVVRSDASAAALRALFGEAAVVVTGDVNAQDTAEAAVAAGLGRWGHVDGLVNNAGVIDPIGAIAETDAAAWDLSIRTNLVAPYRLMRTFIGAAGNTAERRRIVNISSGAAHHPVEGWSAYCAAKAGLAMLTRSVQLEHGADGVVAFGLVPGLVDTDMQAAIRSSGVNDVSRLPRSALRPAAEPALAVAYLLSGAGDDLAGGDVEIRDAGFRSRVGLPPL